MFDLEAVYWTLSTIAQTMVALVAFVGFVAVWRLQVLEQQRSEARRELWRFTNYGPAPAEENSPEFVREQQLTIEAGEDRMPKIRTALAWLAGSGIIATALSLGLLAIAPRLVDTKRVAADLGDFAPVLFFLLFVVVAIALRFAWDVLSVSFRE